MNKIFTLLSSAWNALDIGKESEPDEFKGKTLLAYYDAENTLESSAANMWTFVTQQSIVSGTAVPHIVQLSEFPETERNSWLLDLSRPLQQENSNISTGTPLSA
jgi:hypothetical protein